MLLTAICRICEDKFEYECRGKQRVLCEKEECHIKYHRMRSLENRNKHLEERRAYNREYARKHKGKSSYKSEKDLTEIHTAPPPKESLQEVAKKALAMHMSYGEYMTMERVNSRGLQ